VVGGKGQVPLGGANALKPDNQDEVGFNLEKKLLREGKCNKQHTEGHGAYERVGESKRANETST